MGFFGKIKAVLVKTKNGLASKLNDLFSKNKLGDEFYEELEEILISSDVSVTTAEEVVEREHFGISGHIYHARQEVMSLHS